MFVFGSSPGAVHAPSSAPLGGGAGFTFTGGSVPVIQSAAAAHGGDKEVIRRAIMDVESDGDPYAVSPSGNHYGLYQMGHARAADVGIPDARALLGNPELATWAFFASLEQSKNTHHWEPDLVAVSWKGGNGTLKKALRAMQQRGITLDQALRLESVVPQSWHTSRYLDWFRTAYRKALTGA